MDDYSIAQYEIIKTIVKLFVGFVLFNVVAPIGAVVLDTLFETIQIPDDEKMTI